MATIVDFCNLALLQVGVPYVFGGVNLRGTPDPGLDCSGLEYAVSLALGQNIPRTSEAQFAGLPAISESELRQGDEVFYDVASDNQPQPAHCAIWWSPSEVLQAPRTGLNVGLYPNAQLPFPIMGYRRLPFPDAIPPAPPPDLREGIDMTSWQEGGQNHVAGVVNNKAYHWYQAIGGNPPGQPPWNVEILPTP